MAFVSVSQAATLVRRDRKTLYRDIATGRISASKDASGRVKIDTSELLRVFGPFSDATQETPTVVATPHRETLHETEELSRLRAENESLRTQVAMQAANLDDVRQALKMLEYKPAPKRRWWQF